MSKGFTPTELEIPYVSCAQGVGIPAKVCDLPNGFITSTDLIVQNVL
jgi:hypothetical protein